jgi:hypothetical protein
MAKYYQKKHEKPALKYLTEMLGWSRTLRFYYRPRLRTR